MEHQQAVPLAAGPCDGRRQSIDWHGAHPTHAMSGIRWGRQVR